MSVPDLIGNKKFAILGAARSGIACANYIRNYGNDVILSDSQPLSKSSFIDKLLPGIKFESGGHSDKVLSVDEIIISPGVPYDLPILVQAREKKIPVYAELEFAYRLIQPGLIVAVTGTNGKTTTTSLIGHIFATGLNYRSLKTNYPKLQYNKIPLNNLVVAGNTGTPLTSVLDKINQNTVLVLEVSSYQLEGIEIFRPDIAVILNLTPDHLARHKTMQNYLSVKARIFANQTWDDYAVFNYDDEYCRTLSPSVRAQRILFSRQDKLNPGVFYQNGIIQWKFETGHRSGKIRPKITLPGVHNLENILAATTVTLTAGVPKEIIRQGIETFPGVEHRLECVRVINQVQYINDSKATNVDSVRVALESFTQPIILIMGGQDKGAPYMPLRSLVRKKVKTVLLIGEAAEKIEKGLRGTTKIVNVSTLPRAVSTARELAQPGEIVLLSPGCASFDQFQNFEHRGTEFKSMVNQLA